MGELIKLSDYREVDPVLEMLAFLQNELAEQIEALGGEPRDSLYFTYPDDYCPCCGRSKNE